MLIDDRYEDACPNPQNEIDIFKGSWSCELPLEANAISGGWAKTFVDPKITWFIDTIGGVKGLSGLELGPLEGGHSWMLQCNAVKSLVSVESNRQAFLKCLIVKNILQMNEVEFKLGDFVSYLESSDELFDFILASGVLYHLQSPINALEMMLSKTRSLLIWTHYFDQELIEQNPDQRKKAKPLEPVIRNGVQYETASYTYKEAKNWSGFCGGMTSDVTWCEKSLYVDVCRENGFDVEIFLDEPHHPHGPAFCFSAVKQNA